MLQNILLRKQYIYMSVTFLMGMIAAGLISIAYSHGGDTSLIHGCIDGRGNVAKVGESENCLTGETAVDWNKNTYFDLPFICRGCTLYPYANKFEGKDFSNAQLNDSSFAPPTGGTGADLEGVIFTGAILNNVQFHQANLSNADLNNLYSNVDTAGGDSANFTDANLTNANLSDSVYTIASFDGATVNGTDFTNSDLTGAHFVGATLTSVTWSNTICPDGTNSNSHSNTCIGYLTP